MALTCGWILCPGVHTISRAIVAACAQGLANKGHSAYYRFLSRARWSVGAPLVSMAGQGRKSTDPLRDGMKRPGPRPGDSKATKSPHDEGSGRGYTAGLWRRGKSTGRTRWERAKPNRGR